MVPPLTKGEAMNNDDDVKVSPRNDWIRTAMSDRFIEAHTTATEPIPETDEG